MKTRSIKYVLPAVFVTMGGCGVFSTPSTSIKPASSEVSSQAHTKVRIIPPNKKEQPCESNSSDSD